MRDPLDLTGQVAAVTGAGTGIGRASTLLFAENGPAWPVLFLVNPASSYMTGRTIAVCGGPENG